VISRLPAAGLLRPLRALAEGFALLGGVAAGAVALLTAANIAGRTLASTPISGDVELTQFGIAFAISLCLPWAQLHGANIIVDFFTQKLGARSRQRLDAVGALLVAVFCGLLSWRAAAGASAVAAAGETTMILDAPMWISYAVLAPGLALTALIAVVQALGLWFGVLTQPADAAEPERALQ
jgi:TRAP-type C4-dicarboxylate transport system permease small subunit